MMVIAAVMGASKILVIDDEPGIVRILARMLRQYEVATVTSGTQALELLESGAGFDMVICDMTMPELSGIQLYERIKQSNPGLAARFVFMTGGAVYPEARAFVARGERPCIEKPFDRQVLMQVVDRVLSPEATGA